MRVDKKVYDGKIRLVVPTSIESQLDAVDEDIFLTLFIFEDFDVT